MSDVPVLPSMIFGGTAGALSVAGLWAYSVFAARCQFWGPVVRSLPQREGVALTFEDGPDGEVTPRVLDVLGELGVKGTFFVIGRRAREQAGVLRRIFAEGHAIGNHSLDHERGGWKRGREYWDGQLRETQAIVADAVGQPPMLFRPPWGYKTRHIAGAAAELGLPIIGWSVNEKPRGGEAAEFAARVVKRTSGHDILLLRDGVEPGGAGKGDAGATPAALPGIVEGVLEKGLVIVPLIEALVAASDEMKGATERHARLRT